MFASCRELSITCELRQAAGCVQATRFNELLRWSLMTESEISLRSEALWRRRGLWSAIKADFAIFVKRSSEQWRLPAWMLLRHRFCWSANVPFCKLYAQIWSKCLKNGFLNFSVWQHIAKHLAQTVYSRILSTMMRVHLLYSILIERFT
jgi:hypothetical protein